MIDQEHIAWMGIGISIGGVLCTITWAARKWADSRIERETRNWLRQHNEKGESFDR